MFNNSPVHSGYQALPPIFVNHIQDPKRNTIKGSKLNEVVNKTEELVIEESTQTQLMGI
jgi:hypothetical protein